MFVFNVGAIDELVETAEDLALPQCGQWPRLFCHLQRSLLTRLSLHLAQNQTAEVKIYPSRLIQ